MIAVDQQEVNLTTQEKAELNFCNERVTPYATEFAQYGYTNITERCNSLGGSGAILVTNRYYFHKDNLGSIVGITDNSGTIVTTYDYDSYGNTTLNGIDIGNERLFTGREYDSEIGLYYNRARYYNPKLGRFISQDPIGQVDDVNLYAYVGNNPVNAVDLSGLNSKGMLATVGNLAADFLGHELGRIGAGAYHVANNTTFGLLDWSTGVGSTMQNAQQGGTGYLSGFARGWQGGEENAYMLDAATMIYGMYGLAGCLPLKSAKNYSSWGTYRPNQKLALNEYGEKIPSSDTPHTQIGTKVGSNGEYTQAREWGYNGELKRDIDFTDHSRPDIHTNPHAHDYIENKTGGTKTRGGPYKFIP